MRPDPEQFTQRITSSPSPLPGPAPADRAGRIQPEHGRELLDACGITDLDQLAQRCQQARRDLGSPTGRWTSHCLTAALHLAVTNRRWPAAHAVAALLAVTADPATRSPMRLAEAGPWWDTVQHTATRAQGTNDTDQDELASLEALLDAQDGHRVALQRQAREHLSAEGVMLTRLTVTRRAVQLLQATVPDQRSTPT